MVRNGLQVHGNFPGPARCRCSTSTPSSWESAGLYLSAFLKASDVYNPRLRIRDLGG